MDIEVSFVKYLPSDKLRYLCYRLLVLQVFLDSNQKIDKYAAKHVIFPIIDGVRLK